MASNKSKRKGDAFERKIATLFSDRFKDYLGVDKGFIRNRSSGSYLGGKNHSRARGMLKEHKDTGDIITPSSFRWDMELKHYANPITFKSIVSQKYKQWDDWIDQASQDCATSGKEDFILVIKYNLVDPVVILGKSIEWTYSDPVASYREHKIVPLSEFLSMPNDFYFNKE